MAELRSTIEAVWRIESAALIAHLARVVRDLVLAEDLAQDALVAALETWPRSGVPDRPGAWLMATARNRAIDRMRRDKRLAQKLEEYGREAGEGLGVALPDFDESLDRDIDDEMLSLAFAVCHPVLSNEARVALTLKVLGGLSTGEIARAYLVQETTMAQRIVRAKQSLAEARVPFETPRGEELPARLSSVLEVIYLIFNEGYAASSGEELIRPALCEEALRLGRILKGLMGGYSEVHGLAALMELQASRIPARVGPTREPVLLLDQDRSRWDQLLIRRGIAALSKAEAAAAQALPSPAALGPYALQAEIAACHARALFATDTDWARIAALYDALSQVAPSPVVELNRTVAVGMAYGHQAGLDIIDGLVGDGALTGYHWLPSARGDLLFKLGRSGEAAAEFARAAELAQNGPARALLLLRAEACLQPGA